MEILAMILMLIGLATFIIGGIWFLVVSFQQSVWWGLGCIFLPFCEVIFLIIHWKEAAKPFGLQAIGFVLLLIASPLAP